ALGERHRKGGIDQRVGALRVAELLGRVVGILHVGLDHRQGLGVLIEQPLALLAGVVMAAAVPGVADATVGLAVDHEIGVKRVGLLREALGIGQAGQGDFHGMVLRVEVDDCYYAHRAVSVNALSAGVP